MKSEKQIAVVLAGSGVYDGSEIHEAMLTLYALSKNNVAYQIFAPDINQHHVINHLTGEEMNESRNVLVESARIARGNIQPVDKLNMGDFDALIFPGGFGVAKNLCNFAFEGSNCTVLPEIEKIIKDCVHQNKPLGALCISPVMITKVLGNIKVTIGQDSGTIEAIEKMGGKHETTTHGEVVTDEKHKIVTTPCYMLDATIAEIGIGAENVVKKIISMI